MQDFLNYLQNKKLSKISLKNYKSDISHFTSWLIMKLRSAGSYVENLDDSFPFLNTELVKDYVNFLNENKTPRKTINRRLSSIRNLSNYLQEKNIFDFDFTQGIQNIKHQSITKDISLMPIVLEFKAFLESEKVSPATIKNYTSDVKQFIAWLEKNPTYAQTT